MEFIKNILKNKKNISILSACILVLSLVMFNSITGNTYAADTSGDTSGDVSTNATIVKVYYISNCGGDSCSLSRSEDDITGKSVYPTLPTPTKNGSSAGFLGWYTSTSGGEKASSGGPLLKTGSHYLYARWSDRVTVTFVAGNNASVNPTSKTYTVGSTYDSLPTPTHSSTDDDKWTFAGWYTASSGGDRIKTTSTVKSSITKLYAHWSVEEYNRITFNANGGKCSESSRVIEDGAQIGSLPTCELKGYTFDGWYSTLNSGGYKISASSTYTVDATIYAKYSKEKYTVTFDPNNGVNDGIDYNYVYYGQAYGDMPTASDVHRSGYVFKGWNTKQDGTGTTITSSTTVTRTESHILYAKWEEEGKVSVTYDSKGASTISYTNKVLTLGNKYIFPVVTKVGHRLDGWYYYDSSTYGAKVDENTTITRTAAHTLAAKWYVNTYNIKYDSNGGTGSMISSQYKYGCSSAILPKNSFTKSGYDFVGWKTETGGSLEDGANITDIVNTGTAYDSIQITLYAQWEKNSSSGGTGGSSGETTTTVKYSVIYNANGGTGSMSNSSYTYGTSKNLTVNSFVKTGYIFDSWNTKADGTGTSYSDGESVKNLSSTNNAKVNLYAQWKPISYSVTYNGNGNTSGITATSSHVYDSELALTKNGFIKDGSTFKGWNTKADGTGINYLDEQKVKNLSSKSNETITLYAIWVAEGATGEEGEIKTYTVKYNSNGGIGTLADSTHKYGYASNLSLNTFTKMGCDFVGWNTKKDGTGVSYSDGQTVSNLSSTDGSSVTLYAQWSLKDNVDDETSGEGDSTSDISVNLSLDKAYADRLNLLVNVSNLSSGVSAVCEVYLIPDAGTGYETGSSKVVATINNCKNGKNTVSINNLKADTKYTFQVMVSTDGDMALGDKYVTYKTDSESIIESITESPKTGALAVILVGLISIGSLGGVFYYFKKIKK